MPVMEVCPNCSATVKYANSHVTNHPNVFTAARYRCSRESNVSSGEQRILNGIGNENAVGTIMFELTHLRKLVIQMHERLLAFEKKLPTHEAWAETVEQRDALKDEVEFLKIQVDELRKRNVTGELPER